MSTSTKYIIGFLIVLLFATGVVYITLIDKVKLRVDEDKSTFYVLEGSYWKNSGTEYNKLYQGTSLKYRDTAGIKVETLINNITNHITIKRTTPYKVGAVIIDTYEFDGNIDDKELIPISHSVEVFNAKGFIYQYEVRDLVYDGATIPNPISPLSFGRNMKVSWDDQAYWSTVYKSGILKVRFKPDSDYEKYEVRLFDPEGTCTTYLVQNYRFENRSYELETNISIMAYTVDDNTKALINSSLSIFVNHSEARMITNYTCFSGIDNCANVSYNFSIQALHINLFRNTNISENLSSYNSTYFLLNNISYFQGGNFTIKGDSDSNMLTNVAIFIGNMTIPKEVLPGQLNGTILQQLNFSTGEGNKNITFSSAGSTLVYVNLSRVGKDGGNLSLQVWGSKSDEGNQFSYHEFYTVNTSEPVNVSIPFTVNVTTYFTWDASFINYTDRWEEASSGTATFYGVDTLTRDVNAQSSCSCTGGGGSGCSTSDSDYGEYRTIDFDAEESGRIMVKFICSGASNSRSEA